MATFETLYSGALDTELGSNDSAVLFTTARRRHAINEGYRQFCDLSECLIRQSTVSVSSSAQEFNLLSTAILSGSSAAPFVRIADQGPVFQKFDTAATAILTLAGDADFPQREVQWLDAAQEGWRSTDVGTPTGWYQRRAGGQFLFGLDRPADVSTSETAQLIIPYVIRPSSMTSTSAEPFTVSSVVRTDLQPYQQALVHYAAHDLEKLRKDTPASDRQLQKFLGYVQRYVQAFRPKGPRSLRMAKSYFRSARRGREESTWPLAPWWYR